MELEHKKILLLEIKRVSKLGKSKIAEFILKNLDFKIATGVSYENICNQQVKKMICFAKSTIDEQTSKLLAFKMSNLIKIDFDLDDKKCYNPNKTQK